MLENLRSWSCQCFANTVKNANLFTFRKPKSGRKKDFLPTLNFKGSDYLLTSWLAHGKLSSSKGKNVSSLNSHMENLVVANWYIYSHLENSVMDNWNDWLIITLWKLAHAWKNPFRLPDEFIHTNGSQTNRKELSVLSRTFR